MSLYTLFHTLFNEPLVASAPTKIRSTPESDTGENMVGWVSPEAHRNTWGIIWSCFTIFIVCSWKCVHLNLPSHEESLGEWHKIKTSKRPQSLEVPYFPKRPLFVKWRRKLLWMGFIAIAPEFGVAIALSQYLEAKDDLGRANKALKDRNDSLKQEFNLPDSTKGKDYPALWSDFTLSQAFLVQMGGVVVCDVSPSTRGDSETPGGSWPWAFVSKVEILSSLEDLMDPAIVSRISEEDVKDSGKSDAFTKVFALLQCTWLVVQSIARATQGYAISQLELATLAFIPCALVMYILWWQKPFGVERWRVLIRVPEGTNGLSGRVSFSINDLVKNPFHLKLKTYRRNELRTESLMDLVYFNTAEAQEKAEQRENSIFKPFRSENDTSQNEAATEQSAEDQTSMHKSSVFPSIALYATAIGFSAIHLAAWNWRFPSDLVRELWRWFSLTALLTSFLPVVLTGVIYLVLKLPDRRPFKALLYTLAYSALGLFYCFFISRLVMLGLTFYSVSSMPDRAYEKVGWTAWIPHFS